ncbi:MAG: ribonuclease D [Alphaproteobacteria bacterium]|nr:ribonuclease D [Alphaproteobacteria bacterium]
MRMITQTAELADFCATLARGEFAAIDTEFMRESTYWPKLCLVQAAGPDVEAVIDPQAEGLDLAPLLDVMHNDRVVKVFHAARQDLEIFHRLSGGVLPAPVFDAQIAAMAAGLGDSIAYDALVGALLKRRIDKSSRFTDWSRRPLSEAQLTYALADVTHLRDLYPLLRGKLETAGRLHWIEEELAGLLDPENYDTAPENAWRRLRPRRYAQDYLAALQAAAAWRERVAQARDVPRGRILKDDAIQEVAEQKPRTPQAFDRLRAVPRGFGASRLGQDLAQTLETALADPHRDAIKLERPPSPPPGVGPTIELLKVLLKVDAETHGVAPRLIATSSDLEAIAASDDADVAAMRGWRRDLFGARALDLKHGRIALSLKDGKVAVAAVDESSSRQT